MHVVDFTTLDLQRIPPYHFLHSHNHPLIQKSVQTHHTAKAAPSRYPLSSASRQANNYHQNTPKNYQQNTPNHHHHDRRRHLLLLLLLLWPCYHYHHYYYFDTLILWYSETMILYILWIKWYCVCSCFVLCLHFNNACISFLSPFFFFVAWKL